MLSAAVIGCGQIGSAFADNPLVTGVYSHAGAYDACRATELVAVCDLDDEVVQRCARRWRVTGMFTSLDEMLEEARPDIVSVCTPDATHAAILDRLLDMPGLKGVLAEKPIALDVAEAERLVRRARDKGVALAVNYTRRYTAVHQDVHATIRAGRLGPIQRVSGYYTKGILHNGTHWLDLARWLVGDVVSVEARGLYKDNPPDPSLDVVLQFEGGARGSLLACSADAFSIFEMDIVGTLGRIRLSDSGHRVEEWDVRDSAHYSGYRSLARISEQEGDMRDSLLRAVDDLVASIETGNPPASSGADAVEALRLGALAIASARRARAAAPTLVS